MTIGLLSDTHGHLDDKVFHHFDKVDEIWHAGDFGTFDVVDKLKAFKPLRGVYGNIDGGHFRREFSEDLRFEVAGMPVFMTHIGGYPGRYNKRVRAILKENPPKKGLYICGHSHILKVMPDKKLDFLHINPGAAGNKGWHTMRTLVRFKIEDAKIAQLQVIEIGPRTGASFAG